MDYAVLRKIIRDSVRIDRVRYRKSKVITLAHDIDRSFLWEGHYYSPHIDTIEDDLARQGVHCQSIARIISTIKGDVAYGNVVSPEGAFARALISKRMKALLRRNAYPYSYMEERIWCEILDETGANKVIGIQPSRECCSAVHERGGWAADVQHGIIGEAHIWYGIRHRGNDPREQLPDAFCCWDHGSQEVIDRWAPQKGCKALVVGNRWLARFVNPSPHDKLARELLDRYRDESDHQEKKPTILVTLTWGEVSIPNGYMFDGLIEAIRKTSKDIRWLVRLHPNQLKGFATDEGKRWPDFYEKHLAGHIEWQLTTRYPLPVILAHCDLHISSFTSVGVEASLMGVKSAMLDPRLRRQGTDGFDQFFSYYRRNGMVEFIPETEESILAWIARNIESKKLPEDFEIFDREYAKLIEFLVQ